MEPGRTPMTSYDRFETARLAAERLRADHFDELHRLHQDPRVMATLGGLRDAAKDRRWLRRNLGQWTQRGYGVWILHDRESRAFVGRAGLRHLKIAGLREIELAYTLRAEAWGRGLATEISEAILKIGFGDLGLAELICFTSATNLASRRVMEKVGFVYERDFVYADAPCVLYRQSAAQWQGRGDTDA
jgi:RimJ/RimL family protein N-acetyltransferase